ncbi:MAG: polysaccharide biosynthesis protein [Campylobacteraceae bacterium]|nr:polysaccharide biosynthesis protein [Campylobacteraceae bacterium]
MFSIDKRVLNLLVIIVLTCITFSWSFFIFKLPFDYSLIILVVIVRFVCSFLILKDYSLSWSKTSSRSFLIKSIVYIAAFFVYMPFLYGEYRISFILSELFLYIFSISFLMYAYNFLINRSRTFKSKNIVIYGAGKAGLQLENEFSTSEYKVVCFIDDEKVLQNRSIDGLAILSREKYLRKYKTDHFDIMIIAMPSASKEEINAIYNEMEGKFQSIKILPSLENILKKESFSKQLKDITVEDLLARHPADLDQKQIEHFIEDKTILITGAGGSIGSEISRQCVHFNAKQLILVDHSEINLYSISEELKDFNHVSVMKSVVDKEILKETFEKYHPDMVIHAAAYKHVPLVEDNILSGITNNISGTKNCIDLAIEFGVKKFVLISTDKAVRPTNVMGTTKRICELYAQNVDSQDTEIVAVRFGNVLGSSGSVIPKFKKQIELGLNITVTHPDITRYFMLIPEACELVLQAASIGKGGELFILDMGEPIKIVDLAKKMIVLSGRDDIEIEFCGLRAGEKLYEELLINDSDKKTAYESITVASPSFFDINELNTKIEELINSSTPLVKLKEIVPEFEHKLNS